jgi:hypothetical protein
MYSLVYTSHGNTSDAENAKFRKISKILTTRT